MTAQARAISADAKIQADFNENIIAKNAVGCPMSWLNRINSSLGKPLLTFMAFYCIFVTFVWWLACPSALSPLDNVFLTYFKMCFRHFLNLRETSFSVYSFFLSSQFPISQFLFFFPRPSKPFPSPPPSSLPLPSIFSSFIPSHY